MYQKKQFLKDDFRTFSSGQATLYVDSIMASQKYSDALFNKAMRMAIYQAMRQVKRELDGGGY